MSSAYSTRRPTREATNKLLEGMADGTIDPKTLAERCLGYMSEASVLDMAETEGFIETEDEDEDGEECDVCDCRECECDESDNDTLEDSYT